MHAAKFHSKNSVHQVMVVLNRAKERSSLCGLMQVLKLLIKE